MSAVGETLLRDWRASIRTRDLDFLARTRSPLTDQYPVSVAREIERTHIARFESATLDGSPGELSKRGKANQWLHSMHAELKAAKLSKAFDDEAIRDFAKNYATKCARLSLTDAEDFARSVHVEPPAGKTLTKKGAVARLSCPRWWRRQLRKSWTRRAENGMRELGLVRKGREVYASDEAVKFQRAKSRAHREFLKAHVAVSGEDQLELFELAKGSISNPAIRRGEMMLRMRGFEEIAKKRGDGWCMFTLTTPSRFHAQLADGGANPRYMRECIRAGQAWLCKMWARARAKLKRLSIVYYGFRAAEPHHDGTVHWHLLTFGAVRALETLQTVLRGFWLSDAGDERGALERRVKVVEGDASKGSAAGYLAKYIAKNTDGAGRIAFEADEETGAPVGDSIERVIAWARIQGIRQFQQIGGPPVTLWRELRRLRAAHPCEHIEAVRMQCEIPSWSGFIDANSGIEAGRRGRLALWSEVTGEINRYDELRAPQIVGIRSPASSVRTREKVWIIQRKGTVFISSRAPLSFSALGPVSITVRGGFDASHAADHAPHASFPIRGSP